MIVDTHVHIVSTDRVKHPLHPQATGWSAQGVTNNIEDYIGLMKAAGVDRAVLVQPAGSYAHDNSLQCDSAARYAPLTVAVGTLDPVAPESPDKLTYWTKEKGMHGVRLLGGQSDPDDPRAAALWQRAQDLRVPIVIGGGPPERIDKITVMAARFPGVLTVPDHMAGWNNDKGQGTAMTKALVALAARPNAYLKFSTTSLGLFLSTWKPEEQDLFKQVIHAFTPQRMLWGSNFPSSREGGFATQLDIGRKALAWLSDADRRWVLGDAALQVWPMLKAAAPAER